METKHCLLILQYSGQPVQLLPAPLQQLHMRPLAHHLNPLPPVTKEPKDGLLKRKLLQRIGGNGEISR
ncbi:hypothetical protein D3C73_1444060 [compost metagenome]